MNTRIASALTAGILMCAANAPAQVADRPGAAMPPELERQHMAAKAQLRDRGYMDQLDRVPVSEFMLARVEERLAESRRTGAPLSVPAQGVARLEDFDPQRFPFAVRPVPDHAIRAGSSNYVLPTNTKVRRIYTKTDFGVLLVEQGIGSLVLDEPNLEIAGRDAKVVTTRHKGGKWATTLYASDANHIYRLEANRRLNGPALDAFVSFAEQVIAGD